MYYNMYVQNKKEVQMNKITVAKLREKLQEYINVLEMYDDDNEIEYTTSTYFIHSQYFMQFGNIGFVDLQNLEENINTHPDDDDDDDNE